MSRSAPRVLVVDDDPSIRQLLARELALAGYDALPAADGDEARSLFVEQSPDLVITDLAMPRMDGFGLLAAIRAVDQTPVIVLSVRAEEDDKVRALELGADDYVTKPFGAEELMARIRAALRHRLQQQGAERTFSSGDLSVDLVRRLVKRGSEDVKLSPKEYDILEQLVIHAGKVLTHKHLLREVWRDESVDPQYLRVYVRQLRQKVEADPSTPRHVLTEPGVGYRLV